MCVVWWGEGGCGSRVLCVSRGWGVGEERVLRLKVLHLCGQSAVCGWCSVHVCVGGGGGGGGGQSLCICV